jgi:hypothetical protein
LAMLRIRGVDVTVWPGLRRIGRVSRTITCSKTNPRAVTSPRSAAAEPEIRRGINTLYGFREIAFIMNQEYEPILPNMA